MGMLDDTGCREGKVSGASVRPLSSPALASSLRAHRTKQLAVYFHLPTWPQMRRTDAPSLPVSCFLSKSRYIRLQFPTCPTPFELSFNMRSTFNPSREAFPRLMHLPVSTAQGPQNK